MVENPYANEEARRDLREMIGYPQGTEEPLLPHVCDSRDVLYLLDLIDDLHDALRKARW